ncbi:hypothetical protein [Embleya sp. NPDC005575]
MSLIQAEDVVLVAALIALPCYVASALFAQAEIHREADEALQGRAGRVG